jgi:hypothetical protein
VEVVKLIAYEQIDIVRNAGKYGRSWSNRSQIVMAGKRQHYLPKFLLKGFVGRTANDQDFTWVVRQGRKPFKANIVKVGVSTKFYESSEARGIDSEITEIEGEFSPSLDVLRSRSESLEIKDPLIPDFVCHLLIRTKHLRDSLFESTDFLLRGMMDFMEDPVNLHSLIQTYLRKNPQFLKQMFEEALQGQEIPRRQKQELFRLFKNLAFSYTDDHIGEATNIFSHFRSILERQIKEAAAKGQLGALARAVVPEPRAEVYRRLSWALVVIKDDDLILGDCGPVTLLEPGDRYRAIPDKASDISVVYLPISSHHLVVGHAKGGNPQAKLHEVNEASASCSREFLIGCREDLVSKYSHSLGKTGSLFEPEELEVMLGEITSGLME